MGVVGDLAHSQGDIMRRLRDLERMVREMTAGRRLESASIGRGGVTVDGGAITVKDADGSTIAVLGRIGEGWRGNWIGRAGGGPAFAVYGTGAPDDEGFVALYDRSRQYIVSDDAASGRGLARPYIPVQVGEVTPPTATTTSSSFVDLAAGTMSMQHPVLFAHVIAHASDGSTAGELRMTVDDLAVGDPVPLDAGAFAHLYLGPAALPAAYEYGALRPVRVQARRTAGSGTVGVRVLSMLGLESSWVA